MTLEEIENVDKQLLAARYQVAAMKEFRELATSWLKMPLDELIAKSRLPIFNRGIFHLLWKRIGRKIAPMITFAFICHFFFRPEAVCSPQ
jgi:hypothetical protein